MVYSIADILNYWNAVGIFSYVLPFLLVFAIVYALLKRVPPLNENNAIRTIIAVAVGLLALQFDMVPIFFANIFPKLGVFLAVILAILLLFGFTGATEQGSPIKKFIPWIGVVAAGIVILWSLNDFTYFGGFGYGGLWYFWYSELFWSLVVLGAVVVAVYWVGKQG